jgi:hypothetical protein
MKRYLLPVLLLSGAMLPSARVFGQHRHLGPSAPMSIVHSAPIPGERGVANGSTLDAYHGMTHNALPASITIQGVDLVPVYTSFPQQSNQRSLHNIQVDPTNPLVMHMLLTGTLDPGPGDTSGLLTRRLFYLKSVDGGHNWGTPTVIGTKRTGYGDLRLVLRNGVYAPIIAGHTVTNSGQSDAQLALWVEKTPGAGDFVESTSGLVNWIWPSLAMNPAGDTAWVAYSRYNAADQIHVGYWVIGADGKATLTETDGLPGGFDETRVDPGITTGGEYVIQRAPSGKLGVAWRNTVDQTSSTDRDLSIYYSESTDNGITWSTELTQVAGVSEPDANNIQTYPTGSFDFWFDGENPRFVYVSYLRNFDDQTYYPYSTHLCFKDLSVSSDSIVVVTADPTGTSEHPLLESWSVHFPGNMEDDLLAYPTVAQGPKPGIFTVFYTCFDSTNMEVIDTGSSELGRDTMWYSSIFMSSTEDGGQTWSDPAPFLHGPALGGHLDFRYPMTSNFNTWNAAKKVEYNVGMEIDQHAGWLYRYGIPIFDTMTFGHAVTSQEAGVTPTSAKVTLTLEQNYPNPFNPSTTISFTLTNATSVDLTVEDMMGREVAKVVSGRYGVGPHSVPFNAENLTSGVYRYTLHADGEVVSKTMTLLK